MIMNIIFSDVDALNKSAGLADTNSENLVHTKWNIPKKDQKEVGEKLKKLYTPKTFVDSLASYVSVSASHSNKYKPFPQKLTQMGKIEVKATIIQVTDQTNRETISR